MTLAPLDLTKRESRILEDEPLSSNMERAAVVYLINQKIKNLLDNIEQNRTRSVSNYFSLFFEIGDVKEQMNLVDHLKKFATQLVPERPITDFSIFQFCSFRY